MQRSLSSLSLSLRSSSSLSYLYRRGLDEAAVLEPADEPRGQGEVLERRDGRRDIGGPVLTAMAFLIRAVAASFFLASLRLHIAARARIEEKIVSVNKTARFYSRLLLSRERVSRRCFFFSRLLMPRRHVCSNGEKKWRKNKKNELYRLLHKGKNHLLYTF